MASRAVRERLAQDLGAWLADGLIDRRTHDLLRQRYAVRSWGFAQSAKYLGIAGGLLAFFGLLGVIGVVADAPLVDAVFLMGVGAGLSAWALWLTADRLERFGTTSKMLLTLGMTCAVLSIGLLVHACGAEDRQLVLWTGLIAIPAMAGLAYRFVNTYLLVLALVGFMHWVGSWTWSDGDGAYYLAILHPRVMCVVAVGVVAIGVVHELWLRHCWGRWFQVYEAVGLVYLNLSLLLLSIGADDAATWLMPSLAWTGALFLAAMLQIVAGARLKNGLFTGFGVTAFAVNLYTVYFQRCWDPQRQGLIVLIGGVSLLLLGMAAEALLQRVRQTRS